MHIDAQNDSQNMLLASFDSNSYSDIYNNKTMHGVFNKEIHQIHRVPGSNSHANVSLRNSGGNGVT